MTDDLVAVIARELQHVPVSAAHVALVTPGVAANNARIAQVSQSLLQMEDHPGTFDPWCRKFVCVTAP